MTGTVAEAPAPGANRALWTSTAAFTTCFAVWTIFSIIGIGVKDELGLSETQFGLLIGTPILTGSLIRVVLGVWADQIGGRRVFAGVMVLAAIATFLTSYADTYGELLSPHWASASPADPSRSASPMFRNSSRRRSRAPRSESSARAMSVRRSPSSSLPL